MKKVLLNKLVLILLIGYSISFIACGETPFTGIKFSGNQIVEAGESTTITAEYVFEDVPVPSEKISFEILEDSTGEAVPSLEGNSLTIKTGNVKGAFIKIKASGKNTSNTIWICTKYAEAISAADRPNGFASVGASENFGGYNPSSNEKVVTVSTAADLKYYAKKGGYVIYVDGMIDMSEGMLPTVGGGSTTKLDDLVASKTSYANYATWKKDFSSCGTNVDKNAGTLSKAWKDKIQVNIASNTTIIGLDENAGIKGVTLSISDVKNIAIRNLTLQDGYDPFPHHEAGDGWNSQYDLIGIQGSSSNIWIDHCTLEDTMKLGIAANGEKWQTYDGLCDMKANCKNITISYCVFRNHDKTMLIGSSDSDGNNAYRTITIHHNYWYNCGQRQPMARNVSLHLYNNLYKYSSGWYSQQSLCDIRAGALIMTEKNPGISFRSYIGEQVEKPDSSSVHDALFDIPYGYAAESTNEVSKNLVNLAGSGKLPVIR